MLTVTLPSDASYIAPDGSEIRLLPTFSNGGLSHCTLPAGATSKAVRHKTVDEIWYVLEGEGTLWRRDQAGKEALVDVGQGTCVTIQVLTSFQFRNKSQIPLKILIATMPVWPGPEEAAAVEGPWQSE
jgi:mannose-6-phosphate isomerase-like protein (cupin superfamily)